MTGTATVVSPETRDLARRARGPLLGAAALAVIALVVALSSTPGEGLLDTTTAAGPGSKAVAEVLRDEGTSVRQVRTVDEAAATTAGTLLVAGPDLLPVAVAERLAASGARTVVLVAATDGDVIEAFAPGVSATSGVDTGVRDPACALPAAVRAGPVDLGGTTYRADSVATASSCYPVGGAGSLLVLERPGRSVVLLGAATPLLNDELASEGNAALALNLLGADTSVTWYLPSLTDLYGSDFTEQETWFDLVPRGVLWGLGWLAVVVLLLAAWRARRLGPVVPEALPVVVRASEAVEGRARLYRRGRDRGRAADLLRAAARDRAVSAVGLSPAHATDPAHRTAVVDAVARRTGRSPVDVAALLYGSAPADDAHLVRLADDLDRLDREVHRT